MLTHFTLEYWGDEGWYVGRVKEVPGVFSQGESLEKLEENIRDAYHLMVEGGRYIEWAKINRIKQIPGSSIWLLHAILLGRFLYLKIG